MAEDWCNIQDGVLCDAVNYYHKALNLECCSSPRSASAAVYRRYVGKAFLLFCSVKHVEKIKKYNKQQKNIAFTFEIEKDSLIGKSIVFIVSFQSNGKPR